MEAAFVQRDFALDMSKSALYCTGMNAVESPSGLTAVHRGHQQLRAQAAQADRRERVLERVDHIGTWDGSGGQTPVFRTGEFDTAFRINFAF